jgi:hypothetical protein
MDSNWMLGTLLQQHDAPRPGFTSTTGLLVGLGFLVAGFLFFNFRQGARRLSSHFGLMPREARTRGQRLAFVMRFVVFPSIFMLTGVILIAASLWSIVT